MWCEVKGVRAHPHSRTLTHAQSAILLPVALVTGTAGCGVFCFPSLDLTVSATCNSVSAQLVDSAKVQAALRRLAAVAAASARASSAAAEPDGSHLGDVVEAGDQLCAFVECASGGEGESKGDAERAEAGSGDGDEEDTAGADDVLLIGSEDLGVAHAVALVTAARAVWSVHDPPPL